MTLQTKTNQTKPNHRINSEKAGPSYKRAYVNSDENQTESFPLPYISSGTFQISSRQKTSRKAIARVIKALRTHQHVEEERTHPRQSSISADQELVEVPPPCVLCLDVTRSQRTGQARRQNGAPSRAVRADAQG